MLASQRNLERFPSGHALPFHLIRRGPELVAAGVSQIYNDLTGDQSSIKSLPALARSGSMTRRLTRWEAHSGALTSPGFLAVFKRLIRAQGRTFQLFCTREATWVNITYQKEGPLCNNLKRTTFLGPRSLLGPSFSLSIQLCQRPSLRRRCNGQCHPRGVT